MFHKVGFYYIFHKLADFSFNFTSAWVEKNKHPK